MARLIDADRLSLLVNATLEKILEKMPENESILCISTVASFKTFEEMINQAPTVKETKEEK